VLKLFTDKLQQ